MSYPLKHKAQEKIHSAMEEERLFLCTRRHETLDELRFRQGVIAGLNQAFQIIDEAMKELGHL
jgi:hypothetical protein